MARRARLRPVASGYLAQSRQRSNAGRRQKRSARCVRFAARCSTATALSPRASLAAPQPLICTPLTGLLSPHAQLCSRRSTQRTRRGATKARRHRTSRGVAAWLSLARARAKTVCLAAGSPACCMRRPSVSQSVDVIYRLKNSNRFVITFPLGLRRCSRV